MVNTTGSYHRNFTAFKFSIKSINPKVQSLCVMITMRPIVEKISVTGKVLLQKNHIRSFVDAGHNLLDASDIFDGLRFANAMENTKVGVAKTGKYLSVLNGKTIPDIS